MPVSRFPVVAREGWPFIGAVLFGGLLAMRLQAWPVMAATVPLLALLLLLFRDPTRRFASMPDSVLSPLDGRVLSVEPTDRSCLEGEAVRIRIRVDHLGAYTARSPVAGEVLNLRDNAAAGSRLTGAGGLWVRTEHGQDVVVLMYGPRLLGRPLAFVGYGQRLGQGQRCAYVRLASHAEVYVPLSSRVLVKPGDYVRAATEAIAELVRK